MSYLALALLCSSIFLFIVGLIVSIKHYKFKYKNDYSMKNHYPFEINYESSFRENLFGNIVLILSSCLLIAFFILFETSHQNGFLIFLTIGGVIVTCAFTGLYFVPLKALRTHLLLVVLTITFAFLIACGGGIYCSMQYSENKKILNLVLAILFLLNCLFLFILIINPKLSNWAKVEPVKNEKGELVYKRPGFMILAFTEWMLIISVYISAILTLLLTTIK